MRKLILGALKFFGLSLAGYFLVFWGWALFFRPMTRGAFAEPVGASAVIASFLALIASIFSLIGFLSSTILAWRKEKRDVRSYNIDLEKKELEIEKLKLELARLTAEYRDTASGSEEYSAQRSQKLDTDTALNQRLQRAADVTR